MDFLTDFVIYWSAAFDLWFYMFTGFLIGLYVGLFGPILKAWFRKKRRRAQEEKKEIEELLRQAKEKEPSKERRRVRIQIAKWAAKNLGLILGGIVLVIGFFWSIRAWDEQQTLNSWTQIIELLDQQKKNLLFKTIRKPELGSPVCPEETDTQKDRENCIPYLEETIAIQREQIVCRMRASIAGDQSLGDDSTRMRIASATYRACMLEAGWFTERCTEGNDDCVEIFFSESPCTWHRRKWLESGRGFAVAKQCQSFPPDPFPFP